MAFTMSPYTFTTPPPVPTSLGGTGSPTTASSTSDNTDFLTNLVVTNNKEYRKIANSLINLGVVGRNANFRTINNYWQSMTVLAAAYNKAHPGAQKTTGEYILMAEQASGGSGGSGGGGGGGGGGNGTTVQTQKSVNISSAKDAKAFINQAFQQQVGRDATADEIKQFRTSLNDEEKKNPTITKTTQTVSGSNVSSTSESTGGMDRGAYMLEQGKKAKDYAEFQTETTYMDALMSAISGGA